MLVPNLANKPPQTLLALNQTHNKTQFEQRYSDITSLQSKHDKTTTTMTSVSQNLGRSNFIRQLGRGRAPQTPTIIQHTFMNNLQARVKQQHADQDGAKITMSGYYF